MARNVARSHLLFPALVLVALILFLVPEAQVNNLRARTLSALTPLLNFCGSAARHPAPEPALITAANKTVVEIPKTPAGTPALASAVDALTAELVQKQNEIAKLLSESGARDTHAKLPPNIAADVIARQILWQEPVLAINRGEADGVHMHAGVLFRGAVLGRVISVGPHAACVALLTHRGMSITARLSDCRVEGLLQGHALAPKDESEERLCRMSVVGKELNAKPGENIVTSGYDGMFPPGLWLGAVIDSKKKSDVQWEITVRPACNENVIESVQVLLYSPPEVPWPVKSAKVDVRSTK